MSDLTNLINTLESLTPREIKDLPPLPVIHATNMDIAAGYIPSDTVRRNINKHLTTYKHLGWPTTVNLMVKNRQGVQIGTLTYTA